MSTIIIDRRTTRPLYSPAVKPSGFVIYDGPSMLDGKPIICILTGLSGGSNNDKTGAGLYQTWILRKDIAPIDALHSGDDASICGDCKHRGTIENGRNKDRSCYVVVFQAPQNVWKSYHRGIYPQLPMNVARETIASKGWRVRGGSYGDPASVPYHVWEALLHEQAPGTAYTHQWRNFPELASFCMASVDSESEKLEANLLGFRTFRVRSQHSVAMPDEAPCPASKESGYKATCDSCLMCGGNAAKQAKAKRRNITIIAHGAVGKVNAFEKSLI